MVNNGKTPSNALNVDAAKRNRLVSEMSNNIYNYMDGVWHAHHGMLTHRQAKHHAHTRTPQPNGYNTQNNAYSICIVNIYAYTMSNTQTFKVCHPNNKKTTPKLFHTRARTDLTSLAAVKCLHLNLITFYRIYFSFSFFCLQNK